TGQIRGRHVITSRNTSGYVFLGIPYAEPPLGELRYRAPRPVRPWKGTIVVNDYKTSCLWNSTITSNIPEFTRMSEDCLTVNVFTNEKCLLDGGCAVVYMIHGGEYNFDSPMLYRIDFLVDNFLPEERSVLVVTVTYRLGSFGFLNLSPNLKSSAVKNAGLLDMIEGLRWVQKEISNLGGNPNRVTLMGHSSGAVNAHQLTVSPLTEGLFHRAIIMSALLGIPIPPNNGERVSKQFAAAAGCAGENFHNKDAEAVENVLNCLRKVDAKKLLDVQRDIEDSGFTFQGPCVDGPDGVLPERVEELLKTARPIKMMIGTVGKEMQNTDYLVCADGSVDREGVRAVCSAVAVMFGYRNERQAARKCANEYARPNKTPYILDDPCFFVNSALYSEALTKAGGVVFLYQFDYANVGDAFYLGPSIPKYTPAQSPHHTQEFVYIVGIHLGNFTEKDEIVRVKFSQLLVDFINKGDPSPLDQRWTRLRPELMNYFDIDFDEENNMRGMKYAYHAFEITFWNRTMLRAGGGTVPVTDEALLQSEALVDVVGIPTSNSGSGACNTKNSAKLSEYSKWGGHTTVQKHLHNLIVGSNLRTQPQSNITKGFDKSDGTDWSTVVFIVSILAMIITACYAVFSSRRMRRAEYERFN
uniref:Carboxylesterase type B domain-containing protein n=1 Tax=Parascaris univalens TaxID=6257 RepID=A0A914ZIK3_PARUN